MISHGEKIKNKFEFSKICMSVAELHLGLARKPYSTPYGHRRAPKQSSHRGNIFHFGNFGHLDSIGFPYWALAVIPARQRTLGEKMQWGRSQIMLEISSQCFLINIFHTENTQKPQTFMNSIPTNSGAPQATKTSEIAPNP